MSHALNRVRIVLVHTSHPGNIGAAARALKTMGLSQLYLVNPSEFPSAEATSRASGADDLLGRAVVCDSLDEALKGCGSVIGTTARERSISLPLFSPKELSQNVKNTLSVQSEQDVAIVFGRERSGLTNEEIDACQSLVSIDSNPNYSSLNLGAAVQIMCYELRCAFFELSENQVGSGNKEVKYELDKEASFEARAHFFKHMRGTLEELGFFGDGNSELLMRRLRCLYERAHLTQREVNILRGVYSAIQNQLSLGDQGHRNSKQTDK